MENSHGVGGRGSMDQNLPNNRITWDGEVLRNWREGEHGLKFTEKPNNQITWDGENSWRVEG